MPGPPSRAPSRACGGRGAKVRASARRCKPRAALAEPAAERGAEEEADHLLQRRVAREGVGVGAASLPAAEAVDDDRQRLAVGPQPVGAVRDADAALLDPAEGRLGDAE